MVVSIRGWLRECPERSPGRGSKVQARGDGWYNVKRLRNSTPTPRCCGSTTSGFRLAQELDSPVAKSSPTAQLSISISGKCASPIIFHARLFRFFQLFQILQFLLFDYNTGSGRPSMRCQTSGIANRFENRLQYRKQVVGSLEPIL